MQTKGTEEGTHMGWVGLAYVTVTVAGATMLAQKPQICPCISVVVPQRTTYTYDMYTCVYPI